MNDRKLSPVTIGLIGALVVANVVAIAKSLEALALARQAQASAATLTAVQEQIERMRSDLADVTKKLTQGPAQFGRPAGPLPSFGGFQQDFPPTSGVDVSRLNRPSGANSAQRLGASRPAAPPAQAAGTSTDVTPQVLASHRKDLIDRNAQLHQEDRDRYGDRISTYYNAARSSHGPFGNTAESDYAFSQLLSEYPDAHATGLVIAERALQAAQQADTVAVEEYYNSLKGRQDLSSIVTDSGMEIVPAIQTYLASQYIQQGRTAEAETLMNVLESGSNSGLVAVPGPKGEPAYIPVAEVVSGLRTQISTQTQTQTQTK